MTFTVAIDGLAGSGKGTLALALADKFNLAYFDTGLLYRGLAYIALDEFGEDFTKGLKKFKLVVKLTDQSRMIFRTKAENKTSALKYAKNRWPSATIVSIEEVKQ